MFARMLRTRSSGLVAGLRPAFARSMHAQVQAAPPPAASTQDSVILHRPIVGHGPTVPALEPQSYAAVNQLAPSSRRFFEGAFMLGNLRRLEKDHIFSAVFHNFAASDQVGMRDRLDDRWLYLLRCRHVVGDPIMVITIAALAMSFGARIRRSHRQDVECALQTLQRDIEEDYFVHPPGVFAQIRKALAYYPNDGTPWSFDASGKPLHMLSGGGVSLDSLYNRRAIAGDTGSKTVEQNIVIGAPKEDIDKSLLPAYMPVYRSDGIEWCVNLLRESNTKQGYSTYQAKVVQSAAATNNFYIRWSWGSGENYQFQPVDRYPMMLRTVSQRSLLLRALRWRLLPMTSLHAHYRPATPEDLEKLRIMLPHRTWDQKKLDERGYPNPGYDRRVVL